MFSSKRKIDKFILECWPRYLFLEKRKAFKKGIYRVSIEERRAESKRATRVDPWAFIRVKNERRTLMASLNSILPVIRKGVIGYNECTDGSEEIIKDFCHKHPGFIPFNYPHHVVPACDEKYLEELPFENTLAGYYNAVLDLIPKKEWLIKIDVDQIYFPDILRHSFTLPANKREWVVYSRLNLYRKDGKVKVIDYVRPNDHWLIYNEGLYFVNVVGRKPNGDFLACESLKMDRRIRRRPPYLPECSALHFPFEKLYRAFSYDDMNLIDLSDYISVAPIGEISDEILNCDVIKGVCDSFE